MENFPWTRLANIDVPSEQKPMSDLEVIRQLDPKMRAERKLTFYATPAGTRFEVRDSGGLELSDFIHELERPAGPNE